LSGLFFSKNHLDEMSFSLDVGFLAVGYPESNNKDKDKV
jgi:hypothetical protein